MELYFLVLLFFLMIASLTSGYPVAFALPGSAIISIAIAALAGYLFEGNPAVYFAQDGPTQWLSTGITNFRSLYWDVERDTLIAIPLFIFMGIMLQRSNIAEDLLVAMARLFGGIPGGLGISVIFVGALLAATTGIVGATVIAMGLISLPAMLKNNYSKSLAAGTICASGTLGQIIPPSIVLIILADQLTNASNQARTARQATYREATGEFSMPSSFDVVSASAGDMFMGAFIPGLILVVLYMLYILIMALINPKKAPPVPFEGKYDLKFIGQTLMALVPPLALIFIVLGSIILGVATVNQAGAIGAAGAVVMAGYRLTTKKKNTYIPLIVTIVSIVVLFFLLKFFNLNVKNSETDSLSFGVLIAFVSSFGLLFGIGWSAWRAYKINNTLREVMIETVKITCMVFIILIGATMLTAAFRAFGGEELVKEFLTGLPGGFWMQFTVVMMVIFLLGFFLDFIEISVVVVPIVAPILLADPAANVTAVWLGVMIGMNLQTSFLTPPFGFALFYLRGVAPKGLKTTHIYKGASAFIGLQLLGLLIVAFYPTAVNYLPQRVHLTSEMAPPPMNPKLQYCLEEELFPNYANQKSELLAAVQDARRLNLSHLPQELQNQLQESFNQTEKTFKLVANIREAEEKRDEAVPNYRPTHIAVRKIEAEINKINRRLELRKRHLRLLQQENQSVSKINDLKIVIQQLEQEKIVLKNSFPLEWKTQRPAFVTLLNTEKGTRRLYRQNVDQAYEKLAYIQNMIVSGEDLEELRAEITNLKEKIDSLETETTVEAFKTLEKKLRGIAGSEKIRNELGKTRRLLSKGDSPGIQAKENLQAAMLLFEEETAWRQKSHGDFETGLQAFEEKIRYTIGMRLQKRIPEEQAKNIALCQSVHRDVSLNF